MLPRSVSKNRSSRRKRRQSGMILQRGAQAKMRALAGGGGRSSPEPQTSCRLLRPHRAATCCPSPRTPLSPTLHRPQGKKSFPFHITLCRVLSHPLPYLTITRTCVQMERELGRHVTTVPQFHTVSPEITCQSCMTTPHQQLD